MNDADYWKGRAEHYANEAKHMAASVRHAWAMVALANKRLSEAGLKTVMSPLEKSD